MSKKKNDFFLVLCKQKNKITKYFKLNRITKKIVIDVKKIANDEDMTYEEAIKEDFFKLLIYKKIQEAIVKKRDIYYIPYFAENTDPENVLNIKDYVDEHFDFNLLCFYTDFGQPDEVTKILNNIHEFNFVQLLEDY